MTSSLPKIAIIGSGMAGLGLAELLKNHAEVSLFEKSRGVGGRMSTRYQDRFQFDHGAQFFTARSKAFTAFLKPLIHNKIVMEWRPKTTTLGDGKKAYSRSWFEPHYTAAPRMNSLCKALAVGKNILLNTQIQQLHHASHWSLEDTNGNHHQPFDWVISTAPALQTQALLPSSFYAHAAIAEAKMSPCYSVMLGFQKPLAHRWQAASVKNSCIGWMSVDSSKPGRDGDYSLVIQSTNEWAESHLEDEPTEVQTMLINEASRLFDQPLTDASYQSLHRWRYANTLQSPDEDYLIDHSAKLAVCADWLIEGRVESAFLSASALSKELIYTFAQ